MAAKRTLILGLLLTTTAGVAEAAKCKVVLKDPKRIAAPMERIESRSIDAFPKTGYASLKEFRAALAAVKSRRFQDLVGRFRKNRVEVVMFARPKSRADIGKRGFRNFHETKSSSMEASLKLRTAAEATMLGMTVKEYGKIPAKSRPKYALLADDLEDVAKISGLRHVRPFGSDAYVFDLKKIEDELSLTPGDSLNRASRYGADHVFDEKTSEHGYLTMQEGKAIELDGWDLHFVPWENRELVLPFLYREKTAQSPFIHIDDGYECPPGLAGFYAKLNPAYRSILPDFKIALPEPRSHYVEAQLWKADLSLEDVKAYVFFEHPPDKDHYRALQARGIVIYDGTKRGKKPSLWKPKSDADFARPEELLDPDDYD